MDRKKPILAIKFFRTSGGREPVREFLRQLPKADRTIVGTDLKEVQYGWPKGMPLVRKLDGDLWETRSSPKDVTVRILFTVVDDNMILLHAFIKKSQKTPQKELIIALKRLILLRRYSHEK